MFSSYCFLNPFFFLSSFKNWIFLSQRRWRQNSDVFLGQSTWWQCSSVLQHAPGVAPPYLTCDPSDIHSFKIKSRQYLPLFGNIHFCLTLIQLKWLKYLIERKAEGLTSGLWSSTKHTSLQQKDKGRLFSNYQAVERHSFIDEKRCTKPCVSRQICLIKGISMFFKLCGQKK